METYQCCYQGCKHRAELWCSCTYQAELFCLFHLSNHMSKNQSKHNIGNIYNKPPEEAKVLLADALSQKSRELEIMKKEAVNKYSEDFIQSQIPITKVLNIINSGISYCQAEIIKVRQATEISAFENDKILLSLLQEPEEALKIVINETSQIEINDQIRFLAILNEGVDNLSAENNSKTFYIEKINNLENENKKLIERVQILEKENSSLNTIDPILIQEQFDIQNKSIVDSESMLNKMSKEIDFLKNKINEMQKMIEKFQQEDINQSNEIKNSEQDKEEPKEIEEKIITGEVGKIAVISSETNKSNCIPIDEKIERLSSMFGFSTKIIRWMLIQNGSYETTEEILLRLMDERLQIQDSLSDILAETTVIEKIWNKIPFNIIKSLAENTIDYDDWILSISDDITNMYFMIANKDLHLKAIKTVYEMANSNQNN